MNITDLFRDLSYGELSNLALAGDGNGTITDQAKPKILNYANEGLLRLHAKFPIREQDVLVEMYEHITNYHLLPRYALNYGPIGSEDNEPIRYILDLPNEKFKDDVLKILTVFDSHGTKLPLNNDTHSLSLFTPQAKVLQVPRPMHEHTLSVLYQAKHPELVLADDTTIELADVLKGALTSFIGYKTYSHMNTRESSLKAQEFYALYESICAEALDQDLLNTSLSQSNSRFQLGGWV